jgi:hypothetical protein
MLVRSGGKMGNSWAFTVRRRPLVSVNTSFAPPSRSICGPSFAASEMRMPV